MNFKIILSCRVCNEIPELRKDVFGYNIFHCCTRGKTKKARIVISVGDFKTIKTVEKYWNKINRQN